MKKKKSLSNFVFYKVLYKTFMKITSFLLICEKNTSFCSLSILKCQGLPGCWLYGPFLVSAWLGNTEIPSKSHIQTDCSGLSCLCVMGLSMPKPPLPPRTASISFKKHRHNNLCTFCDKWQNNFFHNVMFEMSKSLS